MKVYISGQVTGLPYHVAVRKFDRTKCELVDAGINEADIWNPIEHVDELANWNEAMAICLPAIDTCNAIFMQRDWRDSLGARQELHKAMKLKLALYFEENNGIAELKKAAGKKK